MIFSLTILTETIKNSNHRMDLFLREPNMLNRNIKEGGEGGDAVVPVAPRHAYHPDTFTWLLKFSGFITIACNETRVRNPMNF